MLSAYVEVLLCVIELLAFVAFKNTTHLVEFLLLQNEQFQKISIPT